MVSKKSSKTAKIKETEKTKKTKKSRKSVKKNTKKMEAMKHSVSDAPLMGLDDYSVGVGRASYGYYDSETQTILIKPKALPETWVDPKTQEEYDNLDSLTDAELKALGWYPLDGSGTDIDEFFHIINSVDYVFDSENEVIKMNFNIVPKNLEEIRYNMYVHCEETKKMIQSCGIVWNDHPIDTREDAMNKFNSEAARYAAGKRNDGDIFQTLDGFLNLTNAEFEEISNALTDFFLGTYNTAKSFWDEITAAQTIETFMDIKTRIEDKTSWPATYL